MIEKPEFLSNRGKVVIAIIIVAVLGAGIYWFNQSPSLQEKINGFNPIPQPATQPNQTDNSLNFPLEENTQSAPNPGQETSGGSESQGSKSNTGGNNNGGSGGAGGSGDGSWEEDTEVDVEGNCSDSEGRICDEDQTCDGSVLRTFDTDQCCFGKCV